MVDLVSGAAPSALRASIAADASRRFIRESLAAMRRQLRMEVAFVGRIAGGTRWFEFVDSGPDFSPITEGTSQPLDETYCARVLDGRLPELVTDASRLPAALELPYTLQLPIGAHVAVPMRATDGRVLGTLCCFSRHRDEGLGAQDLQVARLFADVIGTRLESLAHEHDRTDLVRERVLAVVDAGGPLMVTQPIVELSSGTVFAFEALARFPDVGWTTDEWFDEASAVGLGPELEASAVRAALAIMPRLPAWSALAVNVSASSLCDPRVLALLTQRLPRRLIVELTEHAAIQESTALTEALAAVRAAGVRVAVDDAGSGYAGLHRIIRIQPEVLKLDRALVGGVAHDTARQTMVEAMAWFCGRTRSTLVAEGVEDDADLAVLRRLGVTHAQGYALGRPSLQFDSQHRLSPPTAGTG